MQRLLLHCLFLLGISLFSAGIIFSSEKITPHKTAEVDFKNTDIQTPSPPLSEGIFPCTTCHTAGEYNAKRRKLDEHTNIVFEHDARNRWCLDCHSAANRDKLHLASGELVEFSQSYKLCGQCHGPTYRDWKAGVHGKRTGSWNGTKNYFLCVHCHNPHSPRIKPISPFPAPVQPAHKPFWGHR